MRAQSEVIGLVILFGLTVTAIGVVLVFGQPAITDAAASAQFDRMENEFSLLDSRISTAALGASESQSVSLNVEGGRLASNPDASWMRVRYENATGFSSVLANVTMGNVKYVQGDRTIAYEGGGVWKSEKGSDFTQMVSTPEFHYRGSTLTLPAYNVTGAGGFSGEGNSLSVLSVGDPTLKFPDGSLDNPLEKGNVTITVKSEYYRGWAEYFRSRTTGAVESVNDAEQKVTFSLTVPTELKLTAGIMYDSGYDVQGAGTVGTTAEVEVDLPSADSIVDPKINKCIPTPAPNCEQLSNVSSGDDLDENTIYYVDGDHTMSKDFSAADSNTTILINGDLVYNSKFAVGDESAEPVEVYVDGDLDAQGDAKINTAGVSVGGVTGTGEAPSFVTYVTGKLPGTGSPGFGNAEYTGIIYTPQTTHGTCGGPEKIAGTAEFKGSIIATSICLNGNADVQFDEDLSFLDLTTDVDLIRYLHITENKIRVRK